MTAGSNEEPRVKLVEAVEFFVYLFDYSHEYCANNKDAESLKENGRIETFSAV
jgi:hypothetical protein